MDESPTESEPSPVLTPDTKNATYFDPSDVKESTSKHSTSVNYERIRLLNQGTWKSRYEENKEVTHRQDNLAILDALCGHLQLTDFQKSKARRIFDSFDLGSIGKPVALVAFGICAVVVNDDVPDGSRYHPQMADPDDDFQYHAEKLGFTTSQLHSIIGVVNSRRGE